MNGLKINQKIRYGYAKAAQHLGQPFSLYRSTSSMNPLSPSNLVGMLNMVASQDWGWMKANRPGNAIWYLCVDGQDSSFPLAATEGDFLVGDHTFYVLSKEYQLPMQGMETNESIQIIRPYQSIDPGGQGYVGFEPSTSTILMAAMPASILKMGNGSQAITQTPTDTSAPDWIIQLPNLGDVNLRTGDIVIDNSNENYILRATENTEFGWRCMAQKVVV